MRNKTYLHYTALIFLSFIAAFLLHSTIVSAQDISPETQCYNKKLKASAKYVNCLLRAERVSNRNMVETSDEDVADCHERFEERYTRAEAQAADRGAECPSHGGLGSYQDTIVDATAAINSNNNVKTLNIQIAQEDLSFLNNGSFNLNIAIKVNGIFNVVWRSTSDYISNNQFQWSPIFHMFGTNSSEPGDIVTIGTNVVDIALGQAVVLGINNLLGTPATGNASTGITFINDSANTISPGLAQQLTLTGFTQAITPIYTGTQLLSAQGEVLTPTQEVMVWFSDEGFKTGDIFEQDLVTNFTTVDLANEQSATLNYSNGQWSTP